MRALWSFMLPSTILWYITCCVCSLAYAAEFQNNTDEQALLAFRNAITDDPYGVFSSWNNSLNYCRWQGVSCSSKHPQRVTTIQLSSQGLVGPISPYIGNLSFLRTFLLDNNSFHGEIPREIGNLFRLQYLYLNNNSFQGDIPTNLANCSELRQLNLIDNKLSGIPAELSSLQKLEVLALGQNNFGGTISSFLGNLSSLGRSWSLDKTAVFDPFRNKLKSSSIDKTQHLLIADNNLTGRIPSSVYNISSLTHFSVAKNKLEGELPADIGLTLPNIQQLAFGANQFTGPIPVSLTNASQLQLISFTDNKLSGAVPAEFERLVNLSWIGFSGNMLGTSYGDDLSFTTSLTNCTQLERLYVGDNFLNGSLPNSITNLSTQIIYLSLGINQIYGTIPSGIGNLVNLNLFDMQYLMLGGKIPASIGNLQKLLALDIKGNRLTGQIPPMLGNLTALFYLDMHQNFITGEIPPSLGSCHQLQLLDLSQNDLNGNPPALVFGLRSLVTFNLSHNSFGSLPPEVGNLNNLESLDVSHNKLSGGIPDMLGSCLSLKYLHLEGNFFSGTIPLALSTLRGMEDLDLSHNNLSGPIPEYLGELPFVTNLNLSFNDLTGEVPKTLKNVSAISIFGNAKLCGGIPELRLPKCNIKAHKGGMTVALKVIVPLIVGVIFLSLSACSIIIYYKKNNSSQPSSSTAIDQLHMRLSYQELLKATDGFSNTNLIGAGSYGSVYKGILHPNDTVIAVKVLNLQHRGASKSFASECEALKHVRHRNLLKILSVCSSVDFQGNDFRAVVYEFMPNRSLDDWLHTTKVENGEHKPTVNLLQRLSIAIDVASALEYLHYHCEAAIVHCDLKPSNVLLDNNMVAHVGDFGLAKVIIIVASSYEANESISVGIKGTIGYVAPEYGMGSDVSIQGDAYSYGILLLELFTARRPTDAMFTVGMDLHSFTRMALPDKVMNIVDPNLLQEEEMTERRQECLVSILSLGVSCSMESPKDRMEIRDVVRKLHMVKNTY